MPSTENSLKALREFFSGPTHNTPGRECKAAEFTAFWRECSDEEKAEFKAASLA